MALKKLFKSKTGKLKSDPRIRWFGKLPTYPDYYSSQADEAWAVEFTDWVLKGFELYRSRVTGGRKPTTRLPVSGCAIRLPKSAMTVFASILDYGGDMRGRPFPMCFYAAVPTAQWMGPTSDHMVRASRVIRDLLALRREVPRFINSPGRFESVFGDREVDLDDADVQTPDTSWLTAAKAVTLSQWFEGIRSGVKVREQDAWLRVVLTWGDNLASHESKDFEPTLRFPLAMGLSLDAQLSGWIRWLESRLNLARRSLSLIVSGEPDDRVGYLTIIAREVVCDDFLLLTPLAGTLPYLDDLAAVEPSAGSDDTKVGDESAAPAAVPGSWVDFVCGSVTVT